LLINEAKFWAKARELDYLELFALEENKSAFRFYQKNTVVNLGAAFGHWDKTFYREGTCGQGAYRV
jgi:ribosomal protein S18 acetylase RimI-like enzyme